MAEAYMLFSGSSGNCCYITHEGESILIDAGVSCKMISNALGELGTGLHSIRAVFITHEHSDHTRGLVTISKRYKIPIVCTRDVARAIAAFPETRPYIRIIETGVEVKLGHITVVASHAPHDPVGHVCYRVGFDDGTQLGYATDIGTLTGDVVSALCGCRYVVIESNHDVDMLRNGSYPPSLKRRVLSPLGHLSNAECASLIPRLVCEGCTTVVLAHLSRENNRPEIALAESRQSLISAGLDENSVHIEIAMPDTTVRIM